MVNCLGCKLADLTDHARQELTAFIIILPGVHSLYTCTHHFPLLPVLSSIRVKRIAKIFNNQNHPLP